jgi:hypothetical protein
MKIEDKLKLIIDHAVKQGWDICGFLTPANCDNYRIHQWQNVVDLEIYSGGKTRYIQLDTIIFDHGFSKAFFKGSDEDETISNWRWQMCNLALMPTDERLDFLLRYVK